MAWSKIRGSTEVRIARRGAVGKREENGTESEGVKLPWRYH